MRTRRHNKIEHNARKSTPHSSSLFQSEYFLLFVIAVILCLYAGIFLVFHAKSSSPKMLPEIEKNEMKKLPPDVKNIVKEQMQTASISATLHVPILMYHYVEYIKDKRDKERVLLNVTPNVFEEQIQTLQTAGYTFITAKELGDILDGKMQQPQKPIMLTFDDGHWDLATDVLPLLKKYQVKVTAYIVPGFIDTNSDSLTTQEMQDVVNSGLVDVGAHTVHHLWLKGRSLEHATYEIDESKKMLEQQYHIHVTSFAYPYGAFDAQALALVQQAGFTTAASTIAGNEQGQFNRFFLFRVRPGYATGQSLLNYLDRTWRSSTMSAELKPSITSSP